MSKFVFNSSLYSKNNLLLSFAAFVVVSGTYFVQIRYQLVERFTIDYQAANAIYIVRDYISCT